MSNRLNQERQARLEPARMKTAVDKLQCLGFEVETTEKLIKFMFEGKSVTYYPYSGWASGKSIKDGRGLNRLLNQLKDKE